MGGDGVEEKLSQGRKLSGDPGKQQKTDSARVESHRAPLANDEKRI